MIVKLHNKKTHFSLEHRLAGDDTVEGIVKMCRAPDCLVGSLLATLPGQHQATSGAWTLTIIDNVTAPVEAL